MLVVRRPFRNYGEVLVPGSTVEPGTIKRFKNRVSEGYIIEVSEHDFDTWNEYFKAKFNVELKRPVVKEPSTTPKEPTVVKVVAATIK